MYCQKVCGEVEFSIDDWNNESAALDLTNLSEEEKNEILFPSVCEKQCFDCMAIVGSRRIRTKQFITKE